MSYQDFPPTKSNPHNIRMKTLGVVFVLLVNIIYVSQNYVVKTVRLGAGEVSLVRGLLQILVFSIIMLLTRYKQRKHVYVYEHEKLESGDTLLRQKQQDTTVVEGWRTWLLASLRGFLTASMSFCCVMAVPLMPIGDLVVIAFISPVFSLMLECLILKRPLTILAVILCILIGKVYDGIAIVTVCICRLTIRKSLFSCW